MAELMIQKASRLAFLIFIYFSGLVLGQNDSNTSYNSTPSSTSSAPVTHTVAVAKGGFTFEPDVTLANVGDYIEFDFYPKNHSVVRAEYMYPCIPYELTGVDKFGFFSGFKPVDAILSEPPKFTIRVNDSDPIFYYCSAPGSCIGYGMVGAINPNATEVLSVQRQIAENSTFMLQPGEPWPLESEPDPFTTTTVTFSATPTSSSTSMAPATTIVPTPTSTSTDASASRQESLSAGAIAGISIGAAAVTILGAAVIFLCSKHRRSNEPPPPPQQQYGDQMQHMPKHMSNGSMFDRQQSYYSTPAMSPPLHASISGNDMRMGARSPEFSQLGVAAPLYTESHNPQPYADYQPVHEMYAPNAEGGTMNIITRKAVGGGHGSWSQSN